jgi:hypothetical protein
VLYVAAPAGAPEEARMIELLDNSDGTLSIFTTMLAQRRPRGDPSSGARRGARPKMGDS